jgi:heme-degrading monooxygenase HmoA
MAAHFEQERRPMIVVVFRARRTEAGLGDEYAAAFKPMVEFATRMPGYIAHKGYVAEDGERVTLVEWESPETLRAWRPIRSMCDQEARRREVLRTVPSPGLRGGARLALRPPR